MSNLGDSNTPVEGASFGLPAGAEFTEDANGNLAIADSSGSIVLVRDETNSEWQFENTDLTGINSIDASSANLDSGTIKSEASDPNEIPRFDQLPEGGASNYFQATRPAAELDATWFVEDQIAQGTQLWTFDKPTQSVGAADIDGDVAVLGTNDATGYAVNVSDGSELWSFSVSDGAYSADVDVEEGTVVFGDAGSGLGVSVQSGEELWLYTSFGISANVTAAGISGDIAVFGSNEGKFVVVDSTDGSELFTVDNGNDINGADVDGSVSVFASSDNNGYAIDTTDGSQLWQFSTGDGVEGAAINNDIAVFSSRDGVTYAVDVSDGSEIWSQSVSDTYPDGVDIDGSVVVVGYNDGTIDILDRSNGDLLQEVTTSESIGDAGVSNNRAVFGSSDTTGYAYATSDITGYSDIRVSDGQEWFGQL